MTNETKPILCSACRIPIEGPSEPKGHDTLSCPACGNADTFDNIVASVKAFVTELASNRLQESIGEAVRGSNLIKATLHPIPKGNYPFIVDMKL